MQTGSRLKATHLALTLTDRLMREFRAIVLVLPRAMHHGRHRGAVRRSVAAELIRDQAARFPALSFQQLPEESGGPSWLLRSSAPDAACLRRPSVVVVEPAQHREGHDAPAGLYAARPLPLVRDPLPDPLVRSPPVEVSHPFGEHAA